MKQIIKSVLIIWVCTMFLVTKHHLATEIEWGQQLQKMIAHDLHVIAMQKKEIARLRSELPIKVKASANEKAPEGFVAYRSGGLLVVGAPGTGYHHVEIQTNPAYKGEWVAIESNGETFWYVDTLADTGHFFGVTCEGGSCIPWDVDFVVQDYQGTVRQVEPVEKAKDDTFWPFLLLLGVLTGLVGLAILAALDCID